jgi:predicted dehydrogenase
MSNMAPIRVAIIGLSASASTSWAAEGHLPYLLLPRAREHYEIVALLNSSVRAAVAARAHFGLPSSVRAHGDPAALAADEGVDLVVCCTRVDTHAAVVRPSLEAGKAVFVEWPTASGYASALTLAGLPGSARSIVGLQGRVCPPVLKLKELVRSGRVGRVLSSEARVFANILPRDALPEGLAYFADRSIGGNPLTISYGHVIDFVHDVLGEWEGGRPASTMQIQRPLLQILGADGATTRTVQSDVPDFLAIHGKLASGSDNVVNGASLAVTFRLGPPFKGQPAFMWSINGEKGEILLTSPSGPYIFSGDSYGEHVQIQVHDHETDEVVDVQVGWADWQEELPLRARSTGEIYERFAKWWYNGASAEPGELPEAEAFPSLAQSLGRMKEVDALLRTLE